jgi:hypothetical protein
MAQSFFADGQPLGGMVMPLAVRGWLEFPIPRSATDDGSVAIAARTLTTGAVLSEVLVTRLPLQVAAPASIRPTGVAVTLTSSAPERLPRLEATVRTKDGASSSPVPVIFSGGTAELTLPLPDGASGPLVLALTAAPWVWSDTKVVQALLPPAKRDVHPDSPGLDVVRIPADTLPGSPVLRLPGIKLAPGRYQLQFLDQRGHPIPAGALSLRQLDGRKLEIAGATVVVTDPDALSVQGDVLYEGGAPLLLDRIRLLHSEPWLYDLGVSK